MTTLTLLIAACLYAAAVTALLVVALYGNSDLAAELRRERNRTKQAIARSNRLRGHVVDVINDNTRLRERLAAVEAEALPVLPPWDGPPPLRVVADVEPLIFESLDGAL